MFRSRGCHDGTHQAPLIPDIREHSEPRYQWRGYMLDSARTFWSVDEICELLCIMGRYGLNVFHWHLTDDAGWRFAVPGYPRLTEVSAQLPREPFEWYTNVDHFKRQQALSEAPANSSMGWYSDADISDVLRCAREHGITVMPEVDLPGHMGAVIRAYPHLGDPSLTDLQPEHWTHRNDLLWPTEAAFDFLSAALDRVIELFDHPVVHIGGDECNYKAWEADTELMAQSAAQGITNGRGIQAKFIEHARWHLSEHGRGIAAWDEVTETQLVGDETIIGWRDEIGVTAALDSGNPWVFADAALLYLNRLAGPPESEPAGMFGQISVSDILQAPLPDDDRLLGVQAATWCEFIPDRATLHYHLVPRLLAAAELAWRGPLTADEVADFERRLGTEMEWLRTRGIEGRDLALG